MPTQKVVRQRVTTVSPPPRTSLEKLGSTDRNEAPRNQNQDTASTDRKTGCTRRVTRRMSIVGLIGSRLTGRSGLAAGVFLTKRLATNPSTATVTTIKPRRDTQRSPPATTNPPVMVPRRMARNVAIATMALPPTRLCSSRSSGRMAYFAGPKKADCVPIKKRTTRSSATLLVAKPTPARIITPISHTLTQRINIHLGKWSASCPAVAEKRKNGKMKMPAQATTMVAEPIPSRVIER